MVLRNVATNYTFEQQRQEINLLADDVNTIDSEVTTLQSNVSSLQSLQGTETTDSPTFNNLTLTGYIAGPASMTIDPAAVGDNTGTLVIAGNLQVDGVTTVNSETLTVSDKNITLLVMLPVIQLLMVQVLQFLVLMQLLIIMALQMSGSLIKVLDLLVQIYSARM